MRKSLLLAALLTSAATAQAFAATPAPTPTMTISSTGVVTAEPDQAVIRFGVHSTGIEAGDAMADNKRAMQSAFTALQGAGIAPNDISTTGLALSPKYEHYSRNDGNTPPRIVGYEAHNNVSVTVNDLSGLGDVLDKLVASGVNGIEQVSFGLKDSAHLETEARAKAARSARLKAESYAEAIGTSITGIKSMSEQNSGMPTPYPRMETARAMSASAVPVSAGEMEVSVTVHVVFDIDGALSPTE
jgi:uncharacterized protein